VIIAPFKEHCDLGFFNGAALKDEKQLLVAAGKLQTLSYSCKSRSNCI
jgi:uncharacterized protein YdeI (YjbR/CyaY-like superfamily)